jgi:hypothetical protein
VWLPTQATWLAVRDVISVDGHAIAAADRRLPPLLANPTVSLDQLRSLSEENGRYNIGSIVRTFNDPTLALLFLDGRYRFAFSTSRRVATRGSTAPPRRHSTSSSAAGRPSSGTGIATCRSQGTLWIESSSGRVLQTALDMVDASVGLRGRVTVIYKPDKRLGRSSRSR